jgi:hypothetical protein
MTNPVAPVVREYIEIGAGYVVATKGDGSTYRIHAPDDAERVIVLPEFYHSFYTQMAKSIAEEREAASGELERLRAALNEIVETAKANVPEPSPADPYECGFSDGMDRAAEIASTALQGVPL